MKRYDFTIDNCLKCSLCNSVCPVLGVHPQYPGPKRLGPELGRMHREGIRTDTEWVEYCLGCHRCDLVCPNQVNISQMIAHAKAEHRKPLIRKLRDWWLARPELIGLLATILPYLCNFALSLKLVRFLMSKIMRIEPLHTFPKYSRPNLRTPVNARKERPSILLFPGCFIRYNRPELGRTVIQLLELNGFATQVAASECCGAPATANGDAALARALAQSNVKAMARQVDLGMRIVTACSSCGHMLKTGFGGLLEEDKVYADDVKKIAANTFDLAELLVQQFDAGRLNTSFQPMSMEIAYHAPCHQKSQGIGRPWYHLLCQIPGMTIVDLDSGCCGMSGTYGFKQEKYDVSMAIGHDLFESIQAAHPDMVTTECATCQLQIEHGTAVKTIHPAEVLLQAYSERCFH